MHIISKNMYIICRFCKKADFKKISIVDGNSKEVFFDAKIQILGKKAKKSTEIGQIMRKMKFIRNNNSRRG